MSDLDLVDQDDFTPAPALPSASIVLVRDGSSGLEVLMMKRAATMKFAPGAYVFPGGKVDDDDTAAEYSDHLPVAFQGEGAAAKDLNHRIAAIRELFEESGILYAADRESLKGVRLDRADFMAALKATKAVMSVDKLQLFAHWVTPVMAGRRFDTPFYLAPFTGSFDGLEDGSEMVDMMWLSPRAMLDQWAEGGLAIMFPTRLNLERLAEACSVEEAVAQASKRTISPVLPVFTFDESTGKKSVRIPEEAGFGITEATDKDISAEAKMMKRFR